MAGKRAEAERVRRRFRRRRVGGGLLLVSGLLLLALAGACGSGGAESRPTPPVSHAKNPIRIVTTLPLFADIVRQVGGANVSVVALLPPGANPHTYRPTQAQVQDVSTADIIFFNGLGLESNDLMNFLQQNRRSSRPGLFIGMAANVPSPSRRQPVEKPIYATAVGDNPHLWLDPVLAPVYAATVSDSLNIVDGQNKSFYDGNFQAYRTQIATLDKDIQTKLQGIPADRRKLVTYHDSFIHFANRYGLQVAAVATKDPASPPDAAGVTGLERTVKEQRIPAVFAEAGFDDAAMKRVASDTGAKLCRLYSDALDGDASGYLDMMRANAEEIARCLAP